MAPARTVQHGTATYWSRRYSEGKDYAPLTDQERQLLAALPRRDGARALELCCGTGAVTRHLAEIGYQALGVDFSEPGIAQARERTPAGLPAQYRCVDFNTDVDLVAPHSQDLIVCRLGVAFLDGPLLVDRVTNWLSLHGVFVVVLPDPRHLDPARRTIYLDEQQITDLTAGFRQIERHYTEHLLVLQLSDWAPSHSTAEKRLPKPNACLGVGIVVQDPATGRILLGRSARFAGMLESPGGKPDKIGTLTEDLRHTCARELREETGLVADPADIQLRSVLVDDRGVPRVTVAAYVDAFEGTATATEPDLIEAWDWYDPAAPLPGDLFVPTFDCLAAVFPALFHGRPTRHYPLDRELHALAAARTAPLARIPVPAAGADSMADAQPRLCSPASARVHALPHHARAARRFRLAVAQSTVPRDPSDATALRASGEGIRQLMREAADAGARLVQFPEGALVYPDPDKMPVDPASCAGHVDWRDTQWGVLREEEAAIGALAAELGLWSVFGTIRHVPPARPRNSLLVIDDQGHQVACYDKRILSNTERSRLYSPGTEPVIFDIDGWRFGIAICVEANFHELFAQYESADVDCVLLSVMVDDAMRAALASSYGTLFNFWLGYSVPAQYGTTAPAGIIGPGGPWLTRCPGESRPAVAVTDLDLDSTDPLVATGLYLARPWRRQVRPDRRRADG